METNKNNEYIKTNNFDLACVLSVYSTLDAIKWNETGDEATFIFPYTTYLKEIEDQFWRRALSIEPQALFAFVRAMRSRLRERR